MKTRSCFLFETMRILSIDYGKKRTGIAVTDPLQIIANGLTTVETRNLEQWLMQYVDRGLAQTDER